MGLEIISGVERRRRWSVADKLRIVAEADEPGSKVAEVARRHEISRSILWAWRKQARAGRLTMSDLPAFLPVVVDAVNRPGFVGGSNFKIGWSRYEQDDEQILP